MGNTGMCAYHCTLQMNDGASKKILNMVDNDQTCYVVYMGLFFGALIGFP